MNLGNAYLNSSFSIAGGSSSSADCLEMLHKTRNEHSAMLRNFAFTYLESALLFCGLGTGLFLFSTDWLGMLNKTCITHSAMLRNFNLLTWNRFFFSVVLTSSHFSLRSDVSLAQGSLRSQHHTDDKYSIFVDVSP